MKFASTRGRAPAVGLGSALLAGLAPDGGLYVPESLPILDATNFRDCRTLAQTGARLLSPFFAGDPLAEELPEICAEAFDFPTPLVALSTPSDFVLELFHGPSSAFKDVGARFLAACMRRLQPVGAQPLTILVATSGDTGAAVAAAFHGLPSLRVAILYPDGRVSPRQAHQLGSFGGNVLAYAVEGSFDDCQALAKHALADSDLQAEIPLSSANSISLGRLLPQMSYYAHAALKHHRLTGAPLNFVVPTGNLGNAMAAALARTMGLPIGAIARASNANAVLPEFFAGGEYRPRDSIATLANAMDVGAPSNFERLCWLFPDETTLRSSFEARAVSDPEIATTIATEYSRGGRTFCPHTATAVRFLRDLREQGRGGEWAVVATAHPAKFEAIVEPLIGESIPLPASLVAMLGRPSAAESLPADYPTLRSRLRERVTF